MFESALLGDTVSQKRENTTSMSRNYTGYCNRIAGTHDSTGLCVAGVQHAAKGTQGTSQEQTRILRDV